MIASILLFHFSMYPSHTTVLHNLGILLNLISVSHYPLYCLALLCFPNLKLEHRITQCLLRDKDRTTFGINYFKSSFLHIILLCPGSDSIIICFHHSPWTILNRFMPLFPCPHTNNTISLSWS